MTYFADVRNRPASCSAHLVPLQALRTDLASTATTPNFAWLGANDCADMEGCGIRAGDEFLAAELGAIERSPAWRTQRSLAIITFDEDGFDHEHPAQRVATLVLGSRGVRQGYVSHVRYTHYSLLRTIEAALGLGTLTPNDRYAQPVNDVFGRQRRAAGPGRRPAAPRRPPERGHRPPRAGPRYPPVPPRRRRRRAAPDGVRGELRLGHGHAGRPDHPPRGRADPGRRQAAGHRGHPGRAHRLRGQLRLGHRHPDQHRHPPGGHPDPDRHRSAWPSRSPRTGAPPTWPTPAQGTVTPINTATGRAGRPDPGRRRSPGHRDQPGRPHRVRARLGRRGGHPDRHRHRPGRAADPRGQLPVRAGVRPGRPHRLRRQLRRQYGHADRRGHRAGRPRHPGRPGARRARRQPGRPHRLRGRRRLRHGDPHRRWHRAGGPRASRSGTPPRRSPSPAARRSW